MIHQKIISASERRLKPRKSPKNPPNKARYSTRVLLRDLLYAIDNIRIRCLDNFIFLTHLAQ